MTLPPLEPLLTLGVVLVAGVASGALANKLRLPAVTGQILAGILLGSAGLSFLEAQVEQGLQPVTHFALGLIAVTVGSHLNLRRLRSAARRLGWLVLIESTLTPVLVFAAVMLFSSSPWSMGALLAALAVSTAPATVVAIVKETRSKGVFVKTLFAAVALNNMACVALFEVAHWAVRLSLDSAADQTLLQLVLGPARALGASVLLGAIAGVLLTLATSRVVRPERLATASMVAILLTAGLADFLGVSALLSCMFLGMTLANLAPAKEGVGHVVFADFESAIFAAFFTLAGMELTFQHIVPAGLLALLMVGARMVGKISSGWLAMWLGGATARVRRYLGMALLPQAGVAVGLILLVQEDPAFKDMTEFRELFLAVGLSSVLLNELLGPILTREALKRSGDLGQDRARLIDFIQEENIITDLSASSKEEAIGRLTDLLIRSHHLDVERDALLRSVLEREREMSTCVGGGLAVPHALLETGRQMVGVMGISREGLAFETPDGVPVHCMVLLATPPTQTERHLEVLAALARAIGSAPNIQRQLFDAHSPAHAYDILHAEDFEDFNYFLEDV